MKERKQCYSTLKQSYKEKVRVLYSRTPKHAHFDFLVKFSKLNNSNVRSLKGCPGIWGPIQILPQLALQFQDQNVVVPAISLLAKFFLGECSTIYSPPALFLGGGGSGD